MGGEASLDGDPISNDANNDWDVSRPSPRLEPAHDVVDK